MVLNCGYAITTPGILKIITVVLGTVVIITLWIRLEAKDAPTYFDHHKLDEMACMKLRDAVKNASTHGDNIEHITCPQTVLVNAAIYIIMICLLVSIVSFGLLLFVEQNKQGLFKQIDAFSHLVFGVLLLLAGVLLFVFVGQSFSHTRHFCKDGADRCKKARADAYDPDLFGGCGGVVFINGMVYIGIGWLVHGSGKD